MNPHLNALEDWFRHPTGLSGNNRYAAASMFNIRELRHILKARRQHLVNERVYNCTYAAWNHSSLNQFFTHYWINGPQMRKSIDFPMALFLLVAIGKMRKYQAFSWLVSYRNGGIVNFRTDDFRSSRFMEFCPILSRTQERAYQNPSEEQQKVKELLDEYLPVTVQTRQSERQTVGFYAHYLAASPSVRTFWNADLP